MTSKRYLLITWDGGGVVPPELGLARRLIERGHRVHVLADPTLEAEAGAAGCSFTPWTTAPHVRSRAPEDAVIKDWEYANPLTGMKVYLRDFLAEPAPRWAADVDSALSAGPFDAAIVDFALLAARIPLEAHRVPSVGVMPNIWLVPTKGIPPVGPGFSPSSNPLAVLRDAGMRAMATKMLDRALPPLNAVRASYGLAPLRHTFDQLLGGPVLVLTSPEFDLTSPHQPAAVRYAGPILDDPAWADPWTPPWPDGDDRPLVLASLSSGFQGQVEVLRRVVEALASLDVRGLVTTGLGVDPAEVAPGGSPGAVAVVRSAPHGPGLRPAAAAITHCGHGTTMKALSAGVPLVCLPMGRDQNDTAARVVHRGAGVRLKPTAPSATIAAAVRTVLDDPSHRAGAARLADSLSAGTGCVDPVEVLEQAAGVVGNGVPT
jgi:MGT family glycosyltransferase